MGGRIVKVDIPAGTTPARCKAIECRAEIYFVMTASGKATPVNPDESPHWSTCPAAPQFKEKARLDARLAELHAEKKSGGRP